MNRSQIVFLAIPCATLLNSDKRTCWAQGTVIFYNRVSGVVLAPIYGPENCDDAVHKTGNDTTGYPPGTQFYTGSLLQGPRFRAQLLGAPGADRDWGALLPGTPVLTFRTGAAAGYVFAYTATFSNIPRDAPVATIVLAAWDNYTGLFPDWDSVRYAWGGGMLAAGISRPINVYNIGGDRNAPPTLTGLESFNLYWANGTTNQNSIVQQPVSRTVSAGSSVSFSVAGYFSSNYQWRFNGTNINEATNAVYTISSVQPSNAGIYSALVTNTCLALTSSNATLTVFGAERLGEGTQLSFYGPTGSRYEVVGSSNLAQWVILGIITNTNGTAQFIDPQASVLPWRFYRARML